MNKMQMAHDYALEMLKETLPTGSLYGDDANRVAMSMVELAWVLADAMQAEAEERVNKERPESLCEVDWNQATDNTIAWFMLRGSSSWLLNDFRIVCAPSFGFTGSHIVERP